MKTSEVLREAAKFLEQNMRKTSVFRTGGCGAICRVLNCDGRDGLRDAAIEHLRFVANEQAPGEYWFGAQFNDDQQNHRIVALCLAAAIAESEGD